jgi:hypothetical protein
MGLVFLGRSPLFLDTKFPFQDRRPVFLGTDVAFLGTRFLFLDTGRSFPYAGHGFSLKTLKIRFSGKKGAKNG